MSRLILAVVVLVGFFSGVAGWGAAYYHFKTKTKPVMVVDLQNVIDQKKNRLLTDFKNQTGITSQEIEQEMARYIKAVTDQLNTYDGLILIKDVVLRGEDYDITEDLMSRLQGGNVVSQK